MLESRLEAMELAMRRLESRVRRWRFVSTALVGGICTLLVAGAAKELADTVVKAREFRLEDASGKLSGCFTMKPDGTPGLAMFDGDGYLRLSLDLSNEGAPGVNLHDPRGVLRAALAVRPDGTPGMALFDEKGVIRASVDQGADQSAGIHVYDNAGILRGAMAQRPDGTPAFGLFNGRGEVTQSIEALRSEP
jgi:hypothetical protein